MFRNSRRRVLKSIAAGGGAVITGGSLTKDWVKPVVKSVVLPAHAQTSCVASSITATSMPGGGAAPLARFVVIVDPDTGQVLCGAETDDVAGSAVASGLGPGEYLVLADSEETDTHTITISTECSSETLTYTTTSLDCNNLFATVSIPDGTITPGGGQVVTGPWSCEDGACGPSN
jgi:hypothetical protein